MHEKRVDYYSSVYGKISILLLLIQRINDTYNKDDESRSNDPRNADIMDIVVPKELDNQCPFLIKFYGALRAEVSK